LLTRTQRGLYSDDMNLKSKLKKSKWANGSPSIDIDSYEYSEAGFKYILNSLNHIAPFANPEITVGLDEFISTVNFEGEKLEVHMDNYTCSIAFESLELRDRVFILLTGLQNI
jgi:hypothetical protein